MPQSLSAVYVHYVFSTKERHPFLADRVLRDEMFSYLAGISNGLGCEPLIVGGVADHVHCLVRLNRTVSQSQWVKEVKRVSSDWAKTRDPSLRKFYWQSGYGAFSIDPARINDLRRYIENQEEHHRTKSFKEEFIEFLKAHGLAWDEQYIWD